MIFRYWSNRKGWHTELLFTCEADSILEADKQFQNATDLDPRRTAWVGCTLTSKEENQ